MAKRAVKARPAAAMSARPAAAMKARPAAAALKRKSRTAPCAPISPVARPSHTADKRGCVSFVREWPRGQVTRVNLTLMCKDLDQKDGNVYMFITSDGQMVALRDPERCCPVVLDAGWKVVVDVVYTMADRNKTYEGEIVSVAFKKLITYAEYSAHCLQYRIDLIGYATDRIYTNPLLNCCVSKSIRISCKTTFMRVYVSTA